MTVKVQLPDGDVVEYMRFGDTYVEHVDGSLDVLRGGAPAPFRYAVGEWSGVEGDAQRRLGRRALGRWAGRRPH